MEGVLGAGREGEGVTLLQHDLLPGDGELQLPGQDEDEFNVGGQRVGLVPAPATRFDVGQDGLHPLLAGRREQVFLNPAAAEVDGRVGAPPDYLPYRCLEQGAGRDVQCLAEPDERGDRDVGQVPFQLGHEPLGQPALLGHLGHALAGGEPGRLQLRADPRAVRAGRPGAAPVAGAGHQFSFTILAQGPDPQTIMTHLDLFMKQGLTTRKHTVIIAYDAGHI